MVNNYIKAVRYEGTAIVSQELHTFNDRDLAEVARAAAFASASDARVSVYRYVAGWSLPVVGHGAGF